MIRKIVGQTVVSLFGLLPRHVKRVLLSTHAGAAGILSFQCDGSLGLFQGASNDKAVFLAYCLDETWAPGLQKLLLRIFEGRKGTYIDIGANIGLTVVPIAKARGISCYAFEPERENYNYLRNNIEFNGVSDRINAFNCALYSEDTELQMEFSPFNRGDHRIRPKKDGLPNAYGENTRTVYSTPARRLDSMLALKDLEHPVVMKIDVQGAEVDVLQGAQDTARIIDFLIIEYWPYGLLRLNHHAEELIELMQEFPCGAVLNDTNPSFRLEPISDIINRARGIPSDGTSSEHIDLLLVRTPVDLLA